MNPRVMSKANEAWGTLNEGDRRVAKSLPGRLRAMGLVATLEWLKWSKHPELRARLLEHLGNDSEERLKAQLSSVAFLEYMRRAAAFTEALHLVARADREHSR